MRRLILSLVVCLLGSLLVQAQNREITGKVTDSAGVPLAGASISVKGARGGTSAGGDGNFRISVPGGRKTLVISAIGFDAQEIDVSSASTVSVRLLASTRSLNEVVVTALGIRRERRELGTATQTVGADMLNKSGSGNALAELEGKASGLTVITSTGDPGGGVCSQRKSRGGRLGLARLGTPDRGRWGGRRRGGPSGSTVNAREWERHAVDARRFDTAPLSGPQRRNTASMEGGECHFGEKVLVW